MSSPVNDPIFVKHRVVDDRAALGREHQMDPAVAGLKRARIAEVSVAFADIAARRPGAVLIRRKCGGQRRAPVHAVVEDQEQPAALELEEFDGRVGVGKGRILALAPGEPAVVRLGADDIADRLGVVVSSAAAVGDQVVGFELDDGRLDVAFRRPDRPVLVQVRFAG